MAGRDLTVRVLGDSASVERAFLRSSRAAGQFDTRMTKVGKSTDRTFLRMSKLQTAFAGGVAAGIAGRGISSLADSASDLNEEISKSNVVFDKSASAVLQWSQTTAGALGISRTEALKAAATFGSIFGNTGQTAAQAALLSKAVVTLGADLASFNNTPTQDALDALRSGLSGEIEPLRRFQVFLTEASVSARALADSNKSNVKELTQGEKIMARYNLVLEQTSKQQGDATRTGGEYAGQQKRLRAELADTRAELGQRLLPVMLKVTQASLGLVKSFDGIEASVSDLNSIDFRRAFADAFGLEELKRVIDSLGPELKALATQFQKDVQGVPLTVKPPSSGKVPSFGEPGFKTGTGPRVELGPSVEQRNQFFDSAISRALDRSQDGSLQDQLRKLDAVSATLTKRLAVTKDITRKLNLEDQIVAIGRQKRSIQDEISAALQERLDQAKASRVEAQAKELQRVQARQFKALGLGADGGDIIPGVGNLKKQFDSLTKRLGGSSVNLSSKLESQLVGVRKVLAGELGKATTETRSRIQELFATIRGEFDKGGKGPLTKTTQLNSSRILAGLGLAPADEKQLRARLSQFNSAGVGIGTRPGATGAFGKQIVVEVNLDGQKVSANSRKHNTIHARRNPRQKRGGQF